MEWQDYEEVTKNIYETLGKQAGVRVVCHGSACKVRGKSDVEHQIDVLTSHSDGIHEYLTDIECKYWAETVNKDIVMKVDGIVRDCLFSKGIIVSKMGFTEDATKYAASVNIGLVVLREPLDADWEGRVKTIVLNLHACYPEILRFDQIATQAYENIDGQRIHTEEFYYEMPDGSKKRIREVLDDFQKLLTFDSVGKEIEQEVNFPAGTILYGPARQKIADMKAVKIKGILRESIHTTQVDGEDQVWLIMKSLFENKQYTVSKTGEIRDVT